ncbi:MAG: hypothetical protein P0S95_04445 [Rhabdochlamydiaceae bacterium]|nr:hypothetical protein [Candidatus Amphrikana amoebophyrae]
MMSVSDRYKEGIVVRVFLSGYSSFQHEISEKAAKSIQCASLIKQGIPIKLLNNMPMFKETPLCGFIYDSTELKVIRAFKKDVYSDRFDKANLREEIINGKKKVPLPDSHTGKTVYHRDYESVKGLAEKVTRMYTKYKKALFHSELIMKAKDATKPKKRIIGIIIGKTLFKNRQKLEEIVQFTLKHLPKCPICLYDDDKGEMKEISPTYLQNSFFLLQSFNFFLKLLTFKRLKHDHTVDLNQNSCYNIDLETWEGF